MATYEDGENEFEEVLGEVKEVFEDVFGALAWDTFQLCEKSTCGNRGETGEVLVLLLDDILLCPPMDEDESEDEEETEERKEMIKRFREVCKDADDESWLPRNRLHGEQEDEEEDSEYDEYIDEEDKLDDSDELDAISDYIGFDHKAYMIKNKSFFELLKKLKKIKKEE